METNLFTTEVEVELELATPQGGYATHTGMATIQWQFSYTPDKRGVFSMDVRMIEQKITVHYEEYNEETDQEEPKSYTFFLKDPWKQVKVEDEVENTLHGFTISQIRIDDRKQKITAYLR
jgi:hypothetical protein